MSLANELRPRKVLTITRKETLVTAEYSMLGTKLKHSDNHPYLGVKIAQDLDWRDHVKATTTEAHRSTKPPAPKSIWLFSWDQGQSLQHHGQTNPGISRYGMGPYQSSHIDMPEKVQRKATRFVCSVRYNGDTRQKVPARETIHKHVGHVLPGTSPSDGMYNPTIHNDDPTQNKDQSWPQICATSGLPGHIQI